jgi:hypothetical protein
MRNSFVIARLLLIHLVSNTLHGLAKSEFFFLVEHQAGVAERRSADRSR